LHGFRDPLPNPAKFSMAHDWHMIAPKHEQSVLYPFPKNSVIYEALNLPEGHA